MSDFCEVPSRRKFTTVVVLVALLSLAVTTLALFVYQSITSEENTVNYLSAQASILAAAAQNAVVASDKPSAEAALSRIQSDQHITAACIYNRDGAIIANYIRAGTFDFPIPELDSHRFENGALLLFQHVEANNEIIGHVFLRYDTGSRFAGLSHHATLYVCIAGAVVVITLIFAFAVQRLSSKRTEALPLFADPPEATPSSKTQDELLTLGLRVNEVLQKLQKIEKQLAKQTVSEPRLKKQRPKPSEPFVPVIAKDEVSCSSLDLNAITDQVLQRVRADIQARNAEIKVQPNLPTVWANREIVEQVLTNLISNALKLAPANGRSRIRIGGCVTQNGVKLWVHDNGPGIAPDQDAGLSIVKHDIERMRGQAGVDSAAGQGSTFWIELPKQAA